MNPADAFTVDETKQGAALAVEVRPGARADRIVGVLAGALKIEVTAAPEKGKANKAVGALLAKTLGVAPSSVRIKTGAASRRKRVVIAGVSADRVRAFIETAVSGEKR